MVFGDDYHPGGMTGEDFLAAEVTSVCHNIDLVHLKHAFRRLRHGGQLSPITTNICDFVRDDEMVLGIDHALHIVTDCPGSSTL